MYPGGTTQDLLGARLHIVHGSGPVHYTSPISGLTGRFKLPVPFWLWDTAGRVMGVQASREMEGCVYCAIALFQECTMHVHDKII